MIDKIFFFNLGLITDGVYTVSFKWMIIVQNLNLKSNFCTHIMNLMVIIYTLSVHQKFTL